MTGGLFLGRVEFCGIGGFQERFVSELLDNGVRLRKVRASGGRITGVISPLNYRFAAVIARKHGVRLRAGKRRGLYFSALRYSRRAGLYAGFMVFGTILSIGQATVADIRITGDGPEAQIVEILEECGITRGVPTHGLDGSLAEQRIMLEVENVAWVDVSCVGSRVSVNVESGTPKPDIIDDAQPCNIVSVRDAMVVDTVVRKGQAVTQIGSGVHKGGLLVSGTVADGSGELLYLHANAEVIGEFTETREFFVPYNETVKIADGEQTQFRYLALGEDIYPLFFGEAYAEDSLYSEQTEVLDILGAETPFRLITGTFTKYRDREVVRSDDDCLRELKKLKERFEENFYPEFDMIDEVAKYQPEKEGIRLVVDYTLRGNIAQTVPIEVELAEMS
ncbi:MAG: sporulation protein YqfD [Oscillospiraceae bacterium]|nr:sporulation protein YqfD [Oscillospiraceae bacterium]